MRWWTNCYGRFFILNYEFYFELQETSFLRILCFIFEEICAQNLIKQVSNVWRGTTKSKSAELSDSWTWTEEEETIKKKCLMLLFEEPNLKLISDQKKCIVIYSTLKMGLLKYIECYRWSLQFKGKIQNISKVRLKRRR